MRGSASPDRVLVVGAGMVGLSVAWFLQRRGVEVTVVDRAGVAAGASWGNAGYLTPALTLPLAQPSVLRYGVRGMVDPSAPVAIPLRPDPRLWGFLADFVRHCTPARWRQVMAVFHELNRLSLQAYDQLAEGGVDEPTRPADPFLAVFATPAGRAHLQEELDKVVHSGGRVDYDVVDTDELHVLEPALSAHAQVGIRIHDQRSINPPAFVQALAEAVRDRGGTIVDDFDVCSVTDLGNDGVRLSSAAGDTRTADAVVLANGAWLGPLARPFGVRKIVQAGRGYSFSVNPPAMPTHPLYFPTERVACNPLGDRFRVTGMMEFRPPDAPPDPRRTRTIIEAIRPMFDGVDWQARQEEWVGSRPCTGDGLPLVGATRSARVHVAGGHGMWGIVLGPLTGRLLADSLTRHSVPEVMGHLDPLR